jgi:hypothetical protein
MFLRDKETHDAIEEVELRSLELQAHFSRMEQAVLQRNSLTMTRWRDEHQIDKDCIDFNSVEGLTDNTHGKEVVDLATLQIDRYCDLDERLRDVLREIRDLQREIKHQSIESEDQLQSEENKLENTMSKFMSSEEESQPDEQIQNAAKDKSVSWVYQRHLLDDKEAQLLNNVHNLRRRVAQHMNDSYLHNNNN